MVGVSDGLDSRLGNGIVHVENDDCGEGEQER